MTPIVSPFGGVVPRATRAGSRPRPASRWMRRQKTGFCQQSRKRIQRAARGFVHLSPGGYPRPPNRTGTNCYNTDFLQRCQAGQGPFLGSAPFADCSPNHTATSGDAVSSAQRAASRQFCTLRPHLPDFRLDQCTPVSRSQNAIAEPSDVGDCVLRRAAWQRQRCPEQAHAFPGALLRPPSNPMAVEPMSRGF